MATLTFSEEFNTLPAISGSGFGASGSPNWRSEWFWGARTSDDRSDASYFSDASTGYNPFSVSGGVATIKATPIGQTGVAGAPAHITHATGMLTTDTLFSQQYGYFEIRAKNPAGDGFLGALWLIPDNHAWPPEIDISEVSGGEPSTVIQTVHTAQTGSHTAKSDWTNASSSTTANFHTYGLDWGPNEIVYYLDGVETFRTPTPADAKTAMYLVLSLHVGGTGAWHGDAVNSAAASMAVDYVRVWDWAAGGPPSGAVGGPGGTVGGPGGGTTPVIPTGKTTEIGTGPETITLKITQDAWQGDARYSVTVDGVQVGGVQTASALRGSGQQDTLVVHGAFGGGAHDVQVTFLNDAWGGAGMDRNLHVEGASYNGRAISTGATSLAGTGDHADYAFTGDYAPLRAALGRGPDRLVVKLNQDPWQGDAKYAVSVDGKQIGDLRTARALQDAGEDDRLVLRGDWGAGDHTLRITYVNDAEGDGPGEDRNLYVDRVTFNDVVVSRQTHALLATGDHADYLF
jgi:beta-glucanase (GH16 family)